MEQAFSQAPGTTSRDTSSREIPKLRHRSGARFPSWFCLRKGLQGGSQSGIIRPLSRAVNSRCRRLSQGSE
jgi:hypothetical protein